MATIENIRKHSGWVIGIIALAMFGFLVSDVFTSGRFDFLRGQTRGIGLISGEEIDPRTFSEKLKIATENQRQQLPPEQSISAEMEGQLNDQVWNNIVDQYVMDKEYASLGLEVTGQEIKDLVVGPQPHPIAVQFLVSDRSTGKYEKDQIFKFMSNLDKVTPEQRQFWAQFEDYLSHERTREKYNAMVKSALYVNDLEAKDAFLANNRLESIQYVAVPLSTIQDKDVKISDADLKEYMDRHKEMYRREEARSVDYVTFDINVSKADSMMAMKQIEEQKEGLRTSTNDSLFVTRKGSASNGFVFRSQFKDLPESMEEEVFASDSGTVIGPRLDKGVYKVVKVSAVKMDTNYIYKASHILIRPEGNTKEDTLKAEATAREVYEKLKKGGDFSEQAMEKSQDPGSAAKGGDLGWFTADKMIPKFAAAVKKAKNGDLVMVTTEFGVHIIKVTAPKSNKKLKIAILERPVDASTETERKVFSEANKFRTAIQNTNDFETQLQKMGLNKRAANNIKPNDRNIPGLEAPRELIRWMYDASTKLGDVSAPFSLGSRIVVAKLVKTQESGIAPLADVREQVMTIVRMDKKRDQLMQRVKEVADKNTTLESIAAALKSQVTPGENLSFSNPALPTLPNEPFAIGYLAGMPVNKVSKPIRGENAVIVAKVVSASNINIPKSFVMERKSMERMDAERGPNEAVGVLREASDIKDFRYKYY